MSVAVNTLYYQIKYGFEVEIHDFQVFAHFC